MVVTLRNAEDEGIKPWSDPFASQQGSGDNEDDEEEELGETNGILSYAEGLTAITLTDEFAEEYGWKRLQGDLYAEDVKQIMGTVDEDKRQIPGILTGENEDPGYSPAPYLSRDLTNNFTDAVSFSTTVLMGAIDPNEEVLQEKLVDENNIKQALERNLDWLLENQIDTDEGAGWAWIGGSAEKYDKYEKNIKTHNYFTYSAVIALVDYYDGGLGSSSIPAIEEIRDQRKDEIEDALEKATEFLLNQWWKKGRGGNGWALPKRPAEPNAMASCYAIIALSYLDSKVSDEIEGVNINKDRVNEGMDYIWGHINWIQDDPDSTLWSEKEGYKCRLGNQMEEEYLDGSGPYLYLDTVYEFLNYGAGDIEALDADEEELREWADEFAKKILLKCWAGEKGFIDKGFRHLGLPEEARDNPYDNPTALYTTNVGIETFLTNVLWDPDEEETVIYEKADQDKETEKTKEQAAPTKQNNTTQTVQADPRKRL
ncbi:hypothetical protein [Halonotius sp. GCM10025705]|uniref:hypothetical protein n=1 Tax=Halonotius sp. GCM10025705 TaxID=3252678 RepID=UPI003608A167